MDRTGLSLVRFVASRYRQLQGLRRVVDAVSLLLLWSLLTTEPANGGPLWFAGAMVVWTSLTLWGLARVGRYYRERFGRTASTADSTAGSGSAGEVMLFVWMSMVFGGFFIPLLATYAAHVTWRDWPYRAHWMLLALHGTVFTIAYPGLHSPALFALWNSRFVLTAAPVIALVGLLDHRLLVRAMHRAAEPTPDTEHADTI